MDRIIHFFWSGPDFTFASCVAVLSAIKVHQSDKVMMWHGDCPQNNKWWNRILQEPIVELHSANELRHNMPHVQTWSDYVSYKALYEYGGLYLDTDTVSIKPIWNILPDNKVIAIRHGMLPQFPKPCTLVAVILARKGNLILDKILKSVPRDHKLHYCEIGDPLWTKICLAYPDLIEAFSTKLLAPDFECAKKSYEFFTRSWCPFPEQLRILHYYSKMTSKWAIKVSETDYSDNLFCQSIVKAFDSWENFQDIMTMKNCEKREQ